MIDVTCFDSYGEVVTALTQWDINQILQIKNSGITSDNAPKFHFCNKNSSEALVVAPSTIDAANDVIEVEIPNELLQQAIPLIVYLYAYSDENEYHGMTRATIKIPIRPRPKPSDYVYESNVYIISTAKLKEEFDEMKSVFEEDIKTIQIELNTKAPINHRSTSTAYGIGSDTYYGHLKLSDSIDSTNGTGDGTAATPNAVKMAYDLANDANTAASVAQANIEAETAARLSFDNDLQTRLSTENTERITADNILDERLATVEDTSHTHDNKNVIDGITVEDIENWNNIKEQVAQEQLDAVKEYFDELCFGFTDEFQRIYGAIGVTVYDGGIFGMEQSEIALDGGDFAEETTGNVDCGGFEPLAIEKY